MEPEPAWAGDGGPEFSANLSDIVTLSVDASGWARGSPLLFGVHCICTGGRFAVESGTLNTLTVSDQHLAALRQLVRRLEAVALDWALTGSTGMALQGVPLVANDIDVQTDARGAYELGRLLSDVVLTPVHYLPSERIRSHLGAYELEGVRVEIMGDMEKWVNGSWEAPVDVRLHRRWIQVAELRIPVMDLQHEVEAYQKMGRFERADVVRAWLDHQRT